MPAYLVHQNMRTWNGLDFGRNDAYEVGFPPPPTTAVGGFPAVAAALGGPVAVVGLTEVAAGGGQAGNGQVRAVCAPLFGGAGNVGPVFTVTVGTTAVGGITEYTAIAVRTGVPVLRIGRVSFGGSIHGWSVTDQTAPPPGLGAPVVWNPPGEPPALDYRAVAYVVLQLAPLVTVAVGFLHNTYTLDSRYSVLQKLPWALGAMGSHADASYLGGDFNAAPHPVAVGHPPRRAAWPYAAATVGGPPPAGPAYPGGIVGGTTWAGNLYDYWLSTVSPLGPAIVPGGIAPPVPSVSTFTWTGPQGLMSDHVATVLRIV